MGPKKTLPVLTKRISEIPELSSPSVPPKLCPSGLETAVTRTGFTETLECATVAPDITVTVPPFWNQKIIERIDALKAERHTALMIGDSVDSIFDNYPEFKALELDNAGKVIVPTIDEDRVRDYTSNEAEFNNVMKALKVRIEEITNFKLDFDTHFLTVNCQLNILTSMLQYPQNSQLENYFLIEEFIDTRRIADLLSSMRRTPNRNFIALLVLFSRYGLEDGIIKKVMSAVTTNKWKGLYSNLFAEFSNTNDANFGDLSTRILDVFAAFLNANPNIITDSFIKKLQDGTYMYEIYKNAYENAELLENKTGELEKSNREAFVEESKQELKNRKLQIALPRDLIQKRTKAWLEMNPEDVRTIPTSFIFDRYTEQEKRFMIQENAVCTEIAELTGKLGKVNVPQIQIPQDFFIKESKENDKLASFLKETGPNISKDILAERRRLFFEGRGPFVGLAGGRGKKTRREKYFRIRKKTRNNRKTRSKKFSFY